MKKIMMFALLIVGVMLTGCSVDVDFDDASTKSEKFAEKAEELGNQFDSSRSVLKKLEKKKILSSDDQQQIEKEMENLIGVIEKFKNEEAPFLAKTAKKVAVKELDEMEEVLADVQEKAKERTADKKDIQMAIEALKDDFEFNLFEKQ